MKLICDSNLPRSSWKSGANQNKNYPEILKIGHLIGLGMWLRMTKWLTFFRTLGREPIQVGVPETITPGLFLSLVVSLSVC